MVGVKEFNALRAQLAELADGRKEQDRRKRIQGSLPRLSLLRDQLDRLSAVARALRGQASLATETGSIADIRAAVQAYRSKVASDAESALTGQSLAVFESELESSLRAIDRETMDVWRSHLLQEAPDPPLELLRALANVGLLPEVVAKAERIRAIRSHLAQLASLTAADVASYATLVPLWQQCEGELAKLPDHVREFLIDLVKGNATLDKLGPATLLWFQERGVAKYVRVVASRS
jgi:hypothetical protein